MDIAKEVANYLAGGNLGVVGTSIFIGQIPASINGIYVTRLTGQLENYTPVETAVINIYVKDSSSEDAVNKIEAVKHYIHRMHNTTTSNSYIYSILAIGDVETVERESEYAKIYKLTFEVKHRYLSVIS